jgi:hypothetical protein
MKNIPLSINSARRHSIQGNKLLGKLALKLFALFRGIKQMCQKGIGQYNSKEAKKHFGPSPLWREGRKEA